MKTIWDILQIEPTTDAKAIRIAYALRLKEAKPEVDPEGFQRLREAYEKALKAQPTTYVAPSQSEKKQTWIPKADPVAYEEEEEHRKVSFPKAAPLDHKPERSEAEQFASKLLGEFSESYDPKLLRRWKKEGAFNHLGVSHYFQEGLLELLADANDRQLFLTAFLLFGWNDLRQKPSHPFAKQVEAIIQEGDLYVVEYLRDYSAAPDKLMFSASDALNKGHYDIAQLLLEQINPSHAIYIRNIRYNLWHHGFISYLDDENLTQTVQPALHMAILNHQHDQFDALIESHADINERTAPSYLSPLFFAVKVQNYYAYRKLIQLGALDLPTSCHHTALMAAVYNNDLLIVKELLARGSDPYQCSSKITYTLLFAAAHYGHHEVLKFLLDYGFHPDDVGGYPWDRYRIRYPEHTEKPGTPLTTAISRLDPEMVEMLLQAGADPNRKSCGIPPLHWALPKFFTHESIEASHVIIGLLLEAGADIHLTSDDGQTLLDKATKYGHPATVACIEEILNGVE